MSIEQKILPAIERIYETALDATVWTDALDRVSDITDSHGAILTAMDPHFPEMAINGISSFPTPEDFVKHAENVYPYEQEMATGALLSAPPRTIIYPHECWPNEEYVNLPSVNWLKTELGVHHRCCSRLSLKEAWFDCLILNFTEQQGQISDEAIRNFQMLMPHLAKSIEIQRPLLMLKYRYH